MILADSTIIWNLIFDTIKFAFEKFHQISQIIGTFVIVDKLITIFDKHIE